MVDTNSTGKSVFMEKYLTPIAVVLGAVIIAGAFIFGHGFTGGAAPAANGTAAAPAVNIANVKTAGEPYIGNANAPVTMALFFDYQCPFCKQFDQTVLSAALYSQYVQTGKLKVVFKDFDFIGPDSIVASEYGRAMWQLYPSDFYTWYTDIFNAQDTENTGFGDAASIQKLLGTIPGVDVAKVTALVASNKTQFDAAATADFTEGQADGIQGTPSIIIGTTLLQGAQTPATVTALIDAQLKK